MKKLDEEAVSEPRRRGHCPVLPEWQLRSVEHTWAREREP